MWSVATGMWRALPLTSNGEALVFSSQWPSCPSEVYHLVLQNGVETRLSTANAELRDTVQLPALRRLRWTAPDGVEVEYFLAQPPLASSGTTVPVVLDVHGGPHGFHPSLAALYTAGVLVGAGFAVVMPDPRGSAGYRGEFAAACVGDWGETTLPTCWAALTTGLRTGEGI